MIKRIKRIRNQGLTANYYFYTLTDENNGVVGYITNEQTARQVADALGLEVEK